MKSVDFTVSPYLFFLIIPLIAFTLILFFKTGKRFYSMKNRIASVIIHCLVIILCVTALTGITFKTEEKIYDSELVILVDSSYTSGYARKRADKFIKDVLEANDEEGCSVALVKFGYDQKIAVPMGSYSAEEAYRGYISGEQPDDSATDIYSALSFVWDPVTGTSTEGLITEPDTARILLISDGLQTDREALNVAKLITLDGIRIDTTFFPTEFEPDARVTAVTFPDKRLAVNESFHIDVSVYSSLTGAVDLTVTDNGKEIFSTKNSPVRIGDQTIGFEYAFASGGHHEMKFSIGGADDQIGENNDYYTYYDIESYDNILVIEKYDGESDTIVNILKARSSDRLDITVVSADDAPLDAAELETYDEVILVNIAPSDLPEGFDELLNDFVHEKGGGLFTVGGVERDETGKVVTTENEKGETVPEPHSYDLDMKGTLLQKMLPVQASDFTPPVALAIVIDRSQMMDDDGDCNMDIAIPLALEALTALTPRDLVAVTVLRYTFDETLGFTPMTERRTVEDAICAAAEGYTGSSNYADTLQHVCASLAAVPDVQRRHILFISNGSPNDNSSNYLNIMRSAYQQNEITITEVSVNSTNASGLAGVCGNQCHHLGKSDIRSMSTILKSELGVDEYSGALTEKFTPRVGTSTSALDGVDTQALERVTMNGVLSTMAKGAATVVLRANLVPLYAEWKYGEGKVGSFTSDLYGYWSDNFIKSDVGRKIIGNIASSLMPVGIITTPDLNVEFTEDNYHTRGSIYGFDSEVESDKKLVAFVKAPSGGEVAKFDLSEISMDGNRFEFENRTAGVYDITVMKVPRSLDISGLGRASDVPDDDVLSALHTYRVFSYSAEYDPSNDPFENGRTLLIALSSRTDVEGEDKLISKAGELFGRVEIRTHTFDPRPILISIALCLFLLDIALRKFKFTFLKKLFARFSHSSGEAESAGDTGGENIQNAG